MSFVDSICVAILDDSTLLCGKGNKLILRAGDKRHVNIIAPYDKIHQISFLRRDYNTLLVACAAGREILITRIICNEFKSSFITKMSDWVSSIKVLSNGTVAVVTAHNFAALLEVDDKAAVVKDKLRCDENSTLYCSYIHGSSWDDLIFFGGSALGELLVWRKTETSSEIIHRQFVHNGVIFSIHYNERYLCTTSDDRSIKIFDVSAGNGFDIVEKKQLFGHTSRVFTSKIINFDNATLFLSSGEDSNLCIWNEAGELIKKKNVACSGVIWGLDYNEQSATVITSSSNGKLNKFQLRDILFDKASIVNFCSDDKPAKLRFLENGTLVVLDRSMGLHFKTNQHDWSKVAQPENLQKFSTMEKFKNRLFFTGKSTIVIFDYCDDLHTIRFTAVVDVGELLSTPITHLQSIHALNLNEVFVCDTKGLCLVLNIQQRRISNIFQIPKSREPWSTSVSRVGEDLWLVADRVGHLFLFRNCSDATEVSAPIQKLWKVHGLLGITSMVVQDDEVVTTTGHDGSVKTLFINRKHDQPKIEVLRCEKTSVNWIEKVCNWNGKKYLLGFNDNYFAIYHNRQVIYEHRCGGRHRNWDVTLLDKRTANFTYIQNQQLYSVEFTLGDYDYEEAGVTWHTRDCNALAENENILISGGEDTLLKITKVQVVGEDVKFDELATVNSHISNIKTIATFRDGDDLWIFSAGGRAHIVVTRLVQMRNVKEEFKFMLTNSMESGNAKDSTLDTETRFTSICFEDKLLYLYVGCSDGYVRVFKFTKGEDSSALQMIIEQFYGKCILKVHKFKDLVVTMATDGFVCFWHHDESSAELKFISKVKHNQSGINSFDVFEIDNENFVIGTSGDDSGIFITECKSVEGKVEFKSTISSNAVHVAQVTDFKFMTRSSFYTTSIDQTICLSEIVDSSVKVVRRSFTCISDVKGFVFLSDKHLAVYGAGLEILTNFL